MVLLGYYIYSTLRSTDFSSLSQSTNFPRNLHIMY
nr:MAG TPA: hypothetical protein [Caudoviricetes sp.]